MKKKSTSILGIVIAVLLLIVVCIGLTMNVLFSQHDTPKFFGNYIYMMHSDTMEVQASETADANASIHAKTAVICKAYDSSESISKNNAVLCVLAPEDTSSDKDGDGMAIRRILNIASDEATGIMQYYPTTMQVESIGTEPAITAENIIGICRYESSQMYQFITFATGFSGILILIALPCVLLVIMLIAILIRKSAKKRDDEAYVFEESYDELVGEDNYEDEAYDDDAFINEVPQPAPTPYQTHTQNTASYPTAPTYNPNNTSNFETKKSSIAQNFERKAVNPNSAYQKAKTMQFQAQKNVPILDTPYSQMTQQPQQPQNTTGYVGKYSTENPVQTPTPETESFTASQPMEQTYHGTHEAPAGAPNKTFKSSATSTFKKPNVDDIFGNDALTREMSSSRSTSTTSTPKKATASHTRSQYDKASVDDLLAMIENEKKRLK